MASADIATVSAFRTTLCTTTAIHSPPFPLPVCLKTSAPKYVRPPKPDTTKWVALSAASAAVIVLLLSLVIRYAGRTSKNSTPSRIRLPSHESPKLIAERIPASLHFPSLSYTLNWHLILDSISGSALPGQVMAMIGASGSGKSTGRTSAGR